MTLPTDHTSPLKDARECSGSAGRRRFLGAGTAAVPAVLTLLAQPALGATCFTPSRSLSRNTSVSQTGEYGECRGQSPGNYSQQIEPGRPAYTWPIPPDTAFHPTFAIGSRSGTRFVKADGKSFTMLEVLNLKGSEDPGKVAFHLIGAYLNVKANLVSPAAIDEPRILGIWAEWATRGYFEPVAGVRWYAAEIVDYLKSNGIVAAA